MNALRKSLVLATSFAALGVYNSAMAEMVYKPLEQPVEAPNPNLKIEAVNEKFAEKYPSQFNSWTGRIDHPQVKRNPVVTAELDKFLVD